MEGFIFAGWLKDGVKYDFRTPVTANITLTAKWDTAVPETKEEIEEILEILWYYPDAEAVVGVTKENKEMIQYLLRRAAEEGMGDQTAVDITIGDRDAVRDLINEAAVNEAAAGNYSPVNIEITKDSIEAAEALLNDEEINTENVSLLISRYDENISYILDFAKEYPGIGITVPDFIWIGDKEHITIPMSVLDTGTLRKILTAATNGYSADKLTLDLGSDEKNIITAAQLLGDPEVSGYLIETVSSHEMPVSFKLVVPVPGEAAEVNTFLDTEEGDEYVYSAELLTVENAASVAVIPDYDHVLGTNIPISLPEPSRGYENQRVYTIFQMTGTPEHTEYTNAAGTTDPVTATFEMAFREQYDGDTRNIYLKYFDPEEKSWERDHINMTRAPVRVPGTENTYRYTFDADRSGVYAVVYETKVRQSSGGSDAGTSVWSTQEPTKVPTAEPTVAPTVTPTKTQTPVPTETPAAKSPVPVAGVIAGLGAAAVLFALRRK